MNRDDEKRDAILRFLYHRHKTTRGISKIPVGIRDLQSEMKKQHRMTQSEVASNLDYLVQVQWVREVVRERDFTTAKGMKVSQEQVKYKISDTGIDHLEAGSVFKKPQAGSNINITNVKGVTILGDGNIVNTELTDLSRAIEEMDHAITACDGLTDRQKLDASADLSTIRAQIAKPAPNRSIVSAAWGALNAVATIDGVVGAATRVSHLLASLLASGGLH